MTMTHYLSMFTSTQQRIWHSSRSTTINDVYGNAAKGN